MHERERNIGAYSWNEVKPRENLDVEKFYTVSDLHKIFTTNNVTKFLLVCGKKSFDSLDVSDKILGCGVPYVRFSDFTVNPKYAEVCAGVELFKKENCEAVIAVGGGSAIDVAKCIKAFCQMDCGKNFLLQKIIPCDIPLLAMPTTAGTGSEATQFAVIYQNDNKVSVDDKVLLPNYVVKEVSALRTLSPYQRKVTALDTLCHAVESWWCVNSTEESVSYSKKATSLFIKNMDEYKDGAGDECVLSEMFDASNYAGRAINITRTTAAHAMSYKLTSLYGISHGHAVFLCLPKVWRYMHNNMEKCSDVRGKYFLANIFSDIANALGFSDTKKAILFLENLADDWEILPPTMNDENDIDKLVSSVNVQRLSNNPVILDKTVIKNIYEEILK